MAGNATTYGQDDFATIPNLQGGACTEKLLAYLVGGMSRCIQDDILVVDDLLDYALVLPAPPVEQARYVFIQIEDPGGALPDADRVIKFTMAPGASPANPNQGIIQGQFGAFEVGGGVNLTNFLARGLQAGRSVNLRLQYFV